MQSNIDMMKFHYSATMDSQYKLQNLMSLDGINSRDNKIGILTSDTCKDILTIVFWDISGFSRLTKSFYLIDSEDIIIEFLNEHYRIARSIITHNNGVWDKTIGDGIMSWFGFFERDLPKESIGRDYGALDAINAAIELRNDFQNLKDKMRTDWKINGVSLDFNIKCGINTGQVHIGFVYDQFTAMGTNVNFASRLQEFAKNDQIIIANATRDKICSKGYDLRRISVDLNNPIKSFEDIDCCYEILL